MLALPMDRDALLSKLETHYRKSGWKVKREADGTLAAAGPGGVTWFGAAVTESDLDSEDFPDRLSEMAERRMEGGGELCPLDLIAPEDCEGDLGATLSRLGFGQRRNVSIYSVAA
ncbi:hypothetical protein BH20ACT15_BH20ACT15_15930 [soil metagenome]